MRVVRTVEEFRALKLNDVGLVPTMGYFHEGHLELMRRARADCATVAVSLFVNPTQFGPTEDFARYPRDEARDFALAEDVGVDVMFAPSPEEMYPRKTTTVHVSGVSDRFEGELRPGHFDGVATVVLKLFNIIKPRKAYFGHKDFQQCAVIQRMVEDLNVGIELKFVETLREPDGLAMSSRNVYLSPEERMTAPKLYSTISGLASQIKSAQLDEYEALVSKARSKLIQAGFQPQYLEVVDAESLESVGPGQLRLRILVSAKLGSTKLIDNVAV